MSDGPRLQSQHRAVTSSPRCCLTWKEVTTESTRTCAKKINPTAEGSAPMDRVGCGPHDRSPRFRAVELSSCRAVERRRSRSPARVGPRACVCALGDSDSNVGRLGHQRVQTVGQSARRVVRGGALVHFVMWPSRPNRLGILVLTGGESLRSSSLPAYATLLYAWGAASSFAIVREIRPGHRRWALMGVATLPLLRRSAQHHFSWLTQEAVTTRPGGTGESAREAVVGLRPRRSRVDRDLTCYGHPELVQRILKGVDEYPRLGEADRAGEQRDTEGTAVAPRGDIEADTLENRSHRVE
jgi:hypothetical protein